MTDDELKDIERFANADRHPSARRTEALLRELRHARAELRDARALVKTREKELADERATSEGRRRVLFEKADELRAAWLRAERAEGERDALRAEVERLKQEVTYADRAMHERHSAFADLHADVTLLARDLGLLGEGEEAPADREALWHLMRRAQDAARDQRARLVDLAKDRDDALAATLDLAADRDALRAELVKVTDDARTTFLCNEIARIACERAGNHNERAIRAAEVLAAEVASLRAILDGSEIAPTDKEIEEHAKSGGRWRCVVPDNLHMCADAMHAHAVRLHRAPLDALGLASRWWALDADGRPCPRPVPPSKP